MARQENRDHCVTKWMKDLTGRRFGRLVARDFERTGGSVKWICDCDCGTKGFRATSSNLVAGMTKSCGCLRKKPKKKTGVLNAEWKYQVNMDNYNETERFCCECDHNVYEKDMSVFCIKKGYFVGMFKPACKDFMIPDREFEWDPEQKAFVLR